MGKTLALASLGVLSLSACGGGPARDAGNAASPVPEVGEAVDLDPSDFTVDITNNYWPMKPGDRWISSETDGKGDVLRVEVTVQDGTHEVASGIEARVVHDLVTRAGAVVEDTIDWYAQDSHGNIWYVGEQTAEYENGRVVSTEGSWESGVDGAQPGIAVPAHPLPGLAYRQEYRKGEAADRAVVLSTDEKVQTPTGTYTGALLTRETTPLEPDVAELKFYVPGVGQVLTLQTSGGSEREALVEVSG